MKIAIDISQVVYEKTGVASYVREIVSAIIKADTDNEYILFGASFRLRHKIREYYQSLACSCRNVSLFILPIPISLLEIIWNKFHLFPVEYLLGRIDFFWSSDWMQPPLRKAIGLTTIHDLAIYKYPQEHISKIVCVQKRRLERAIRECRIFLCDSHSTKKDASTILNIPEDKLHVVYPGFNQSL